MPGKKRQNNSKADNEKLKQTEKQNKLTRFDPRNVKGNIELFQHINELQMLKYRKMFSPSDSLKVKKRKKNGKYSSIVEDFGIKVHEENQEEEERKEMEQDAQNNKSSPVKMNDTKNSFEGFSRSPRPMEDDDVPLRGGQHEELKISERIRSEERARTFKLKFREILAKKFLMFAQNEILMKSYMEEKKKLDFHIRRDN